MTLAQLHARHPHVDIGKVPVKVPGPCRVKAKGYIKSVFADGFFYTDTYGGARVRPCHYYFGLETLALHKDAKAELKALGVDITTRKPCKRS